MPARYCGGCVQLCPSVARADWRGAGGRPRGFGLGAAAVLASVAWRVAAIVPAMPDEMGAVAVWAVHPLDYSHSRVHDTKSGLRSGISGAQGTADKVPLAVELLARHAKQVLRFRHGLGRRYPAVVSDCLSRHCRCRKRQRLAERRRLLASLPVSAVVRAHPFHPRA